MGKFIQAWIDKSMKLEDFHPLFNIWKYYLSKHINIQLTRGIIQHKWFTIIIFFLFFLWLCACLLVWVCLFWNDGGPSQGQSITSLCSGSKNVRAASCVVHQHHLGESISTMLACEERSLYTWFIDWWMLHRKQHALSIHPSLPPSLPASLLASQSQSDSPPSPTLHGNEIFIALLKSVSLSAGVRRV